MTHSLKPLRDRHVMGSLAMVEELAWLIKDNLLSKNVVLSTEDLFVEFLDSAGCSSKANMLMLEPMISYHRMLLHRLADIFGLAHESIGEGDNRRLVVERCESSLIPEILVSDILVCNDGNGMPFSASAPQLLKRNTGQSGFQSQQVQAPQISFEERQAAYLAARERIFSQDWGQVATESSGLRTRPVPMVARRMIAHALGKRVLADSSSCTTRQHDPHHKGPTLSIPTSTSSKPALNSRLTSITEFTPACSPQALGSQPTSTSDDGGPLTKGHNVCMDGLHGEPPDDVSKNLSLMAAKRMFAHALGIQISHPSCRASSRSDSRATDDTHSHEVTPRLLGRATAVFSSCESSESLLSDSKEISTSSRNQGNHPVGLKFFSENEQGKAAQRIFAHALGFRGSSAASENLCKRFDTSLCMKK